MSVMTFEAAMFYQIMTAAFRLSGMILLCFTVPALVHILINSVDKRELARSVADDFKSRVPETQHDLIVGDRLENLFWFMQISDLHFSAYQDNLRVLEFETFCQKTVPVIHPELISVSGDLTDARKKVYVSSDQSISEWTWYKSILVDSGVLKLTKFFDIRGNHDMFGVVMANHSTDLFSKYSVQGQGSLRSYAYTVQKPFGSYGFISMDASPRIGINFPLNFFGEISLVDGDRLRAFAAQMASNNHTFWFGHYPTSTIVSPHLNLRALLGQSAFAYFCGHLHTIMHLIPRMYSLQPQGYLELELGDWKNERYYRVVAVDHDLVSFVDVKATRGDFYSSQWPVVIVTNPKNSDFSLPHKEPTYRILTSTHIRILAWSPYPVYRVVVSIDKHFIGNASQSQGLDGSPSQPLFILAWNPERWNDQSVHTLQAVVTDSVGNQRTVTQPFVVNAHPSWNFAPLASFALQTDHSFNIRLVFYSFNLVVCCTLIVMRFFPNRFIQPVIRKSRLICGARRFVQCNMFLIPTLAYLIYSCLGPIFMGFLIDGHFGIVFSFGVFISGSLVLESLTFLYETVQLILFTVFYLMFIFWLLGRPHTTVRNASHRSSAQTASESASFLPPSGQTHQASGIKTIYFIPIPLFVHCVIFTLLQLCFLLVTVGFPYGLIAVLLSPGRLIPIGLSWFVASQTTVTLLYF